MRTILIHLRKSFKLILLLVVALLLILGIMYFLFRPMYAVRLNGQVIGYTDSKNQLVEKINKSIKIGDGNDIAFFEIDVMPEYEACYSKKNIQPNEEEVFNTVIASGTPYYRNFAILQNGEEKLYVSTFEEAEKVIANLKEKKSTNIDSLTYNIKYSSDKLENSSVDNAVAALFVEPPPPEPEKPKKTTTYRSSGYGSGSVNLSQTVSYGNVALGINLVRPVSGTITSRFGRRSSGTHTGLDIATSKGTPIAAAAAGTVSWASRRGGYGNLVVIDHGNGVQTYYGHCNTINVSVGQYVSQGQTIATIGSTGNSTGPHLHLEVRVDGTCQNPQNYLY